MEKYGVVWVIVDGLSDVAPASLGHRTPLQKAPTPVLDSLTKRGRGGLLDPVRAGLACGSDTAHLSMFGYNPEIVYRGRGAFETVGAGLAMSPGDVAFKCNLATMSAKSDCVKRRCASSAPEFAEVSKKLSETLNGALLPSFPDVKVAVRHAVGHRIAVSFQGEGLSDRISNTDPLYDGQPLLVAHPLDDSPEAERTAAIANETSKQFRKLLQEHPLTAERRALGKPVADVVLLRGAAEQIKLTPFSQLHDMRAFLIAPTKIINGIGITASLDIVQAPGATGGYDTDLNSKARVCVDMMSSRDPNGGYTYDMGIIHVKAVDEAGHDRSVPKKVYWLEQVDKMVGSVLKFFTGSSRDKIFMVVTGDHTTSAEFGDHTCEPVPILFVDITPLISNSANGGADTPTIIGADDCTLFDEINIGSNGSLGRFPGSEIMVTINKLLGSK